MLNAVGGGVLGEVIVEVIPDVAHDLYDHWVKGRPKEEVLADLEAVAQCDDVEWIDEAVAEAGVPESARADLVTFLRQVPATIRASQRRPEDWSGRTMSPRQPLEKPDDLLVLLPGSMPRFRPGQPAPGFAGWTLAEPLGAGGFGEVWRATKPHLDDRAVKYCTSKSAARTLQRERELVGRVIREARHPGVIRLIEYALDADPPGLMVEYVAGGTLAGLVAREPVEGRVGRALERLTELSGIVAAMHALTPPIVHRDLKPANVLIDDAGRLRVADFGIGAAAAQVMLKTAGHGSTGGAMRFSAVRGACTPLYASPEQQHGGNADPRDDVFALGVIGLQMLTGRLNRGVTAGWTTALQKAGVPAEVIGVFAEALADDAEDRLPDARALHEKLLSLGKTSPKPAASATLTGDERVAALQRLADAEAAREEAKRLAERRDYAGAAKRLETVSAELRGDEYGEYASRRDLEASLEEERKRLLAGDLTRPRLRAVLKELLTLNPTRKDLEALLGRLPAPRALSPELVNSVGMKFRLIPAGTFLMGSPAGEADRSDDEQQHEVKISRPFYLATTPVTQAQFEAVMGYNPGYFSGSGRKRDAQTAYHESWPPAGGKDKVKGLDTRSFPVENVSWDEAVEFCRRLAEKEAHSERLYRLPTEAEWECSCRGGVASSGPFHFGATLDNSQTQANFDGNHPYGSDRKSRYLERTCPVGEYPPSALGLKDMHGNVWEWCADWYDGKYYAQSPPVDPPGPSEGSDRVLRGGSWSNGGRFCRSAYRGWLAPGDRNSFYGFRPALVPA
ncbi:MAG: bifunctional serine/threonine-protein kinase/formylglycine-generating enzyme family protein [Gemmataceae bacterium]